MTGYFNLNRIVEGYFVSKQGGVKELLRLQERLSDVPVSLKELYDFLDDGTPPRNLSGIEVTARFFNPQMRIALLDELVKEDEADDLTTRMVLPYPVITLSGEAISEHFYEHNQSIFGKLILPNKKDSTARVLSKPTCSAAAIIYERGKKINYIEMVWVKENIL